MLLAEVEVALRALPDDEPWTPPVPLTLQMLPQAVTVHAAAVNQGPKGAFVYVVGPGAKAAVQPVNVLATEGAVAVVQSGLKPGQTVVTDGQMSLKPGLAVCYAGGPPCGPARGGPGGAPGGGRGGA